MKRLSFTIQAAVLVVLLAFLTVSNFKLQAKRKKADREVAQLENQLAILEDEKILAQTAIVQSTLPEYLEKIAREQLNFQKPGETIIAFPIIETQATSSDNVRAKTPSLWQRILQRMGIRR